MSDTPLDRLAWRASADPFFLGFRMREYARVHELDDDALAARLGCGPEQLAAVRLCRAPRTGDGFREDVLCVAEEFGLSVPALAEVAKFTEVVPRREATPVAEATPGVLLAARDRQKPA